MERNTLDELAHVLRVPRRNRQTITRELRAHIDDVRHELELSGWNPEDAERESVHRLGDPQEIADGFEKVYRPSRHTQLGLAIALATGMLLGVWGIGGSFASATSAHNHHAHVVTVTRHISKK